MANAHPIAYRRIMEMAAQYRSTRNVELATNNLEIIDRRDLRRGDLVYAGATLEPLFTVDRVELARAQHYVVVTGVDVTGASYRTSGHVLDDVIIRRRER